MDFAKPVYVLVDRLALSPEIRSRLMDSIEICYREGRGEAILEFVPESPDAKPERLVFNERFECKKCGAVYQEPEPRLFSFNNPYGACPRCQGFGNTIDFDIDRVIPDKSKSLAEGAIEPWTKPRYRQLAIGFAAFRARERHSAGRSLPRSDVRAARRRSSKATKTEDFVGVKGFFTLARTQEIQAARARFPQPLSRLRHLPRLQRHAPARRSSRRENRGTLDHRSLPDDGEGRAAVLRRVCNSAAAEAAIAEKVLEEIQQRLRFLDEVGLDYLTLDRLTSTLSGGEAQRIQLATSLGSHLVGALYVLDEPSIGLHPRDTHRLIEILKGLRDLGNTLLVVEHDPDTILAADHILDLGPGAGEHGGKLIFAGTRDAAADGPAFAHRALSARRTANRGAAATPQAAGQIPENLRRAQPQSQRRGRDDSAGPAGGGHRRFRLRQIHAGLRRALQSAAGQAHRRKLARMLRPDRRRSVRSPAVEMVDQSPIGRTPRSNPATYLKAFDPIREVFASTPEAKKRGLTAGHFSFNIPGGRCEACQGDGTVTVEMRFLADVELVCEECRGTRYKSSVLEVHYKEKNIHDVLQMTVREALDFFRRASQSHRELRVLEEVGLGYLRLGQSGTTLSGGEAQRLKLAAHLTRQDNNGHPVYLR